GRRIEDVEVLDDLLEAVAGPALLQVDGDDAPVDVDRLDPAAGEEAAGQLVGWPVAAHLGARHVALVAHAGDGPVGLEPDHARVGDRGLLDDDDRLTHGPATYLGRP